MGRLGMAVDSSSFQICLWLSLNKQRVGGRLRGAAALGDALGQIRDGGERHCISNLPVVFSQEAMSETRDLELETRGSSTTLGGWPLGKRAWPDRGMAVDGTAFPIYLWLSLKNYRGGD